MIKVLDMGVSNRLDETRNTSRAGDGTPKYMAPEQMKNKLSLRTDVWSFGCVMLELATGIQPYQTVVDTCGFGIN